MEVIGLLIAYFSIHTMIGDQSTTNFEILIGCTRFDLGCLVIMKYTGRDRARVYGDSVRSPLILGPLSRSTPLNSSRPASARRTSHEVITNCDSRTK